MDPAHKLTPLSFPCDTKDYWRRCKDYIKEIEPIVENFWWYRWGEGLDEIKQEIKSALDFIYYVHRCHSLYLRWNDFHMECPYCYDSCWGWNGVSKRCDNDNCKSFYWNSELETKEEWLTYYSIDADIYEGYGSY